MITVQKNAAFVNKGVHLFPGDCKQSYDLFTEVTFYWFLMLKHLNSHILRVLIKWGSLQSMIPAVAAMDPIISGSMKSHWAGVQGVIRLSS